MNRGQSLTFDGLLCFHGIFSRLTFWEPPDEAVLWLAETDRSPPITEWGLQVPINVSNQREVARWARKIRETCKHTAYDRRCWDDKRLLSSLPPSFPTVSPTQLMEVGQSERVRSAPVPGGPCWLQLWGEFFLKQLLRGGIVIGNFLEEMF